MCGTEPNAKKFDRLFVQNSINFFGGCNDRWSTFERLEAQHDALVNQSIAGMLAKFGRLRELLER